MRRVRSAAAAAACWLACAGHAEPPAWQQEADAARRSAERGENVGMIVPRGLAIEASFPPGVYVYYNNPRPLCYAYRVPGEWVPMPGRGLLRSPDGRTTVGVNFRPPAQLGSVDGATVLERGQALLVRELEKALHQRLSGVERVRFDSERPGVWQLKTAPLKRRDGTEAPLPLTLLVDLSPQTIAEVQVSGAGDDETLARQIVAGLKTTTDPACYWPEFDDLLKALYAARKAGAR